MSYSASDSGARSTALLSSWAQRFLRPSTPEANNRIVPWDTSSWGIGEIASGDVVILQALLRWTCRRRERSGVNGTVGLWEKGGRIV